MTHFSRLGALFAACIMLAACSHTRDFASTVNTSRIQQSGKVLLMPLDVRLSLLTASGVTEPNATWTEDAKRHIQEAVLEYKDSKGFQVAMLDRSQLPADLATNSFELEKLHRAVGNAILIHKYAGLKLPTKKGKFDWTLGDATKALAAKYGADQVLFIFVRDSYTSAGRMALQFFASMVGVGVQGGQTVAFASLVDAKTGDVTWFNVLSSGFADLRDMDGDRKFVHNLFDTLPVGTAPTTGR
ncbi:hypothetical protein [Kordiimonas marina]|uniref:hypothetical protein n=1 Tax=Kordiimonas marina TaxID=2872312 RepID=UPI001FF5FB98|nr:hypothetical protein [Kordiimonas marina]MCJ9429209.1 hypothetical protein [Kordiimonas marina]